MTKRTEDIFSIIDIIANLVAENSWEDEQLERAYDLNHDGNSMSAEIVLDRVVSRVTGARIKSSMEFLSNTSYHTPMAAY